MSAAPAKAKAPKKPAEHPKYADMITAAIRDLKERNGSSRQAIIKYIRANYKVADGCESRVKLALKRESEKGTLVHSKGVGASGSFKVNKEAEKSKKKPVKKPAAKKPKTKKPAAKAKKPATKKTSPKKAAAKKSPKKPAAKKATTPKKAAAKKPAKKTAAKKPAAKKAVKKPAAKKTAKKSAAKKSAKK